MGYSMCDVVCDGFCARRVRERTGGSVLNIAGPLHPFSARAVWNIDVAVFSRISSIILEEKPAIPQASLAGLATW